jgi:hypothetical protein
MFVSTLPLVVCGRARLIYFTSSCLWEGSSYLCYLSLCIVVSNTYIVLCFSLCLVYPMLPVPLDCPLLIAPSVFSNVDEVYMNFFNVYVLRFILVYYIFISNNINFAHT